ncbi:hypothetical protein FRC09_008496 [Ceratobasidium sp. 395]|nr:hypothetical protein FRC09_008496 [Ceratobasidium sp. 395]
MRRSPAPLSSTPSPALLAATHPDLGERRKIYDDSVRQLNSAVVYAPQTRRHVCARQLAAVMIMADETKTALSTGAGAARGAPESANWGTGAGIERSRSLDFGRSASPSLGLGGNMVRGPSRSSMLGPNRRAGPTNNSAPSATPQADLDADGGTKAPVAKGAEVSGVRKPAVAGCAANGKAQGQLHHRRTLSYSMLDGIALALLRYPTRQAL